MFKFSFLFVLSSISFSYFFVWALNNTITKTSFINNHENKNPISRPVITVVLKPVLNRSCYYYFIVRRNINVATCSLIAAWMRSGLEFVYSSLLCPCWLDVWVFWSRSWIPWWRHKWWISSRTSWMLTYHTFHGLLGKVTSVIYSLFQLKLLGKLGF